MFFAPDPSHHKKLPHPIYLAADSLTLHRLSRMGNFHEYDAIAKSIKIRDITSDDQRKRILHRLRRNDRSFTEMTLFYMANTGDNYDPESGYDLGWLGYYIGNNTQLKCLSISIPQDHTGITREQIEFFCKGLKCNKSIETLDLGGVDLNGNFRAHDLEAFFQNNSKLVKLEMTDCECDRQVISLISLAKTVTCIELCSVSINGEAILGALQALGTIPQLESLSLIDANMGRNECMEVAAFLRSTATHLRTLGLGFNPIDDESVEALVLALSTNKRLRKLSLTFESDITTRGWHDLSTLLDSPNSHLEELNLAGSTIDDEGALVLASALLNNQRLKTLGIMHNNNITSSGWATFSQLLCDKSTINKTLHSNHTLASLGINHGFIDRPTREIESLLSLNFLASDKKQAAIRKILRSHPDFDMEPLFEWDFKILPFVIDWFNRAAACRPRRGRANIQKRRLSGIYQFIRGMPTHYIESRASAGSE